MLKKSYGNYYDKIMLIEFAGLPGSGKTTIKKLLIEIYDRLGYSCFSEEDLIKYRTNQYRLNRFCFFLQETFQFCAYYLSRPLILFSLICYASQVKPFNKIRFKRIIVLLKMIYKIHFSYSIAEKNQSKLVIFDQGIVQAIWSLIVDGHPPNDKYLKLLLKTLKDSFSVVVFLQIDSISSLARIQNRSCDDGRFDRMNASEVRQLLEGHKEYIERIIENISGLNGKENIIYVNGNDDPAINAIIINRFLGIHVT